jgi:hypothetical protein
VSRASKVEGIRQGVSKERWEELKPAGVLTSRYLHVSCQARIVNDPDGIHLPRIPWVGPGTTYNVGRNAAKRARRVARA